MTVLHILDELNRGGAETLVLDLCRNAKKNGLDMMLVSLRGGDLEDDFRQTDVDFTKLGREKGLDINTIFNLRKIITQKEIEIIHTHTMVATVHAYLASVGLKVKRVITHHGIDPDTQRMRDKLSMHFLVPKMNMNIAVSKVFLKRLEEEQGYNLKNFCVIYNGIDIEKFEVKRYGKKIPIEDKEIIMGMVANFVKSKDQLTVCKALPSVFSKFPISKFIFIGAKTKQDASYFEECREFCIQNNIEDKVIFAGKKNNIPEVLKSLDLFIFSSLNESFGIAVVEAMLSRVPVVLSDIPAMLEITDNGKYAKIFEKGSPDDLAQKIEGMLCDMDNAKNLAAKAKTWAEENFSIESHIKELLHLYKNIN